TRPCTVFVLGALGPAVTREALGVASQVLDRTLASVPHVLASGRDGSSLLGLVQFDAADDSVLRHLLQSVELIADEGGWSKPLMGSGTPATGLAGVRRSRSEALIAYETGLRLRQGGLIRFEDLGVERL